MNRGLERWVGFGGILFLLASLQFFATLAGAPVALGVGLVGGAACAVLLLRTDFPSIFWAAPTAALLADLLAILAAELGLRHSFALWFCPVLAGAGASLAVTFLQRTEQRCNLCHRRLGGQVVFQCPRCHHAVCDETCWSFEHRRCQLCLEQRVPILPMQDSWWNRVTGPRVHHGRCQLCLAGQDAADLRACPRCRRQQCRPCWDFNNGECARCAERLPELPESLTMAVAKLPDSSATASSL